MPIRHVQDLDDPAVSIAMVRHWARGVLSDLTEDVLEDVVLVLNELASNALDHGVAPRLLRLHRSIDPCLVRVEVADGSSDEPVVGTSRLHSDRGRGLILVNGLAQDWGVVHQPGGKTVWAEISCAP